VFVNVSGQAHQHSCVLHARAGQPGQGERRESATDVRLDGDEMPADADDGDAGDALGKYILTNPRLCECAAKSPDPRGDR
jgi:hypothetical protein